MKKIPFTLLGTIFLGFCNLSHSAFDINEFELHHVEPRIRESERNPAKLPAKPRGDRLSALRNVSCLWGLNEKFIASGKSKLSRDLWYLLAPLSDEDWESHEARQRLSQSAHALILG